jgi:hypothetical protein
MQTQRINHINAKIITLLSCIALLTVLTGYFQPPQRDEGTGAHIFQISIVLLAPTILIYFATADWKQWTRSVRRLILPVAALALAFAALSYLEHFWYAIRP